MRGHLGPPEGQHGAGDIPLGNELVLELRGALKASRWQEPTAPVFPARNGKPLSQRNLMRRVLQPAREEACLS